MSYLRLSLSSDFSAELAEKLEKASPKAVHAVLIQIQKDTSPYVPADTKSLVNRAQVIGNTLVYPGPYARYLYYGKVMVDRTTGKGPSRFIDKDGTIKFRYKKGAKLKPTNRDLNISQAVNPYATKLWLEESKKKNMKTWVSVAGKVIARELGR